MLGGGLPVFAEEAAPVAESTDQAMFVVNNLWMLVATFLVFTMHLGFATLEAGLARAKNTVNILFKNTAVVAIGLLTYTIMGFALMYPGESNWMLGKWIGFAGFGIGTGPEGLTAAYNHSFTYWTDFLFQGMFAATAATIVSGAVAERIKLSSFLVFSFVYVMIVYPIAGSWGWGGGWLAGMGFHDFAGSTFVHSVGGWAALVGVAMLGPRVGKYVRGVIRPIVGHSMPLATIGVFLLWLGWFGFNGGSVLSADPGAVSYVFVTTTLAAAAGIFGAMITSWNVQHKPDLSMVLNGCLAGLVGITAGADCVSVVSAIIIGAIAGVVVVLVSIGIDRFLRLDDPVGALSVHLICGIWGTLAVGIFGSFAWEDGKMVPASYSLWTQLLGVIVVGVFCLLAAAAIFATIKAVMGIRVHADEELVGLDISEHGMEAYGGFQIFSNE
ncbi:MAG: ammonium transporter [Spartobacteria bacterium]|nr:ammonium transporter [Spartobacteria bacterium]